MNTLKDICGPDDVRLMVDQFYDKISKNELLAPIFNFRLSSYWPPHLHKMYDFWNAALFGIPGYAGNPFAKHATMPLDDSHFSQWLALFNQTVDDHFSGPVADDAKRRALAMADSFKAKLSAARGNNTIPLA